MVKLIYIVKRETLNILAQSKNLLILFLVVAVLEENFFPVLELAKNTDLQINFADLLILMLNNKLNVIAIPIIFISLISNFPALRLDYFSMIRLDKRQWLVGEIAFIFMASFLFIAVIFLAICPVIIMGAEVDDSWSGFMKKFALENPDLYERNKALLLGAEIMTHGTPFKVLIYSATTMWLYLIIVGLILTVGVILENRWAGILTDIVITLSGGAILYSSGKFCWIFPIYHVMYGFHFNEIYAKEKLPLWVSYTYLLMLTVLIIIFCSIKIHRMDIGEQS